MIEIYKFFSKKSQFFLFQLIIYYCFYILLPILPKNYHDYLIRNMPIVFILLIFYPLIIVLILSYLGSGYLSQVIEEAESSWDRYMEGKLYIKSINMIKILRLKSSVARILATIFYPFYLSIVYFNFLYIIFGLKNEKLLKRRILFPALISYFTAGLSSIFILMTTIIILFYKIKKEKAIAMELSKSK